LSLGDGEKSENTRHMREYQMKKLRWSNGKFRLIVLICWTMFVVIELTLAVGMAGGVRQSLEGNPVIVLFALSPMIPLWAWLRKRNVDRRHDL
jgi:hypothetical protein